MKSFWDEWKYEIMILVCAAVFYKFLCGVIQGYL